MHARRIDSLGILERKNRAGENAKMAALKNQNSLLGLKIWAILQINNTRPTPNEIKGSLTPKSDLPKRISPRAVMYDTRGNW